jgi:hypothetical protein
MMAEGMFGIGFTSIDGHHLELDNEFAFSKFQTREEWEKEQKEYADFVAYLDSKENERTEKGDTQDPLASAWSGIKTDEPLPGDELGYLQMAFMVAEIISEIQVLGGAHEEIKELNECFAGYRQSDEVVRLLTATEFKAHLQALADRYPRLVSRSADLQSRIDESERFFADDSDYPF